jgi:hypothetical protein
LEIPIALPGDRRRTEPVEKFDAQPEPLLAGAIDSKLCQNKVLHENLVMNAA